MKIKSIKGLFLYLIITTPFIAKGGSTTYINASGHLITVWGNFPAIFCKNDKSTLENTAKFTNTGNGSCNLKGICVTDKRLNRDDINNKDKYDYCTWGEYPGEADIVVVVGHKNPHKMTAQELKDNPHAWLIYVEQGKFTPAFFSKLGKSISDIPIITFDQTGKIIQSIDKKDVENAVLLAAGGGAGKAIVGTTEIIDNIDDIADATNSLAEKKQHQTNHSAEKKETASPASLEYIEPNLDQLDLLTP